MSVMPLAQYLRDFDSDWESGPAIRIELDTAAEGEVLVASAEQLASETAEAHALGLQEGREAAEREYEERLAEEHLKFQQQLALERQVWIGDTGERLAEQIKSGLSEIARSLAETSAHLLVPFLSARIRDQALADIQAKLAILLARSDATTIDVHGPEDLLQELRNQLSDTSATVNFVVSTAADLRVSIDETVIETRIADWVATLQEYAR